MATFTHSENRLWESARLLRHEQHWEAPIWEEAFSWLALVPTLFITVSGRIQTETGPVAFRFTAMEEDSISRRITRLVCLVLILLLVSTRFQQIVAMCRRSKLLLLLPTVAFASVMWSQSPVHTLVDALNLLLTTLFAIYLFARYPGDRIVSFLVFSAFVSLLLCIFVVVAFPSVGIDALQQDSWRGIFGQRNNCAAACTLFLVVGLHAKTRDMIEQLIGGSVVVLSLVFIVMSGSRQGWILAVLAPAITYGLRFTARIRSLDRVAVLMLVALSTILIAYVIGSNLNQVLAAMDKDPTLTQRTIIWAQVLPSILKHPFLGYGYSAFWTGMHGESMQTLLTTGWMQGQAQDGYLDTLLQLGLLGLVPLVAVFVRGFAQAATAIERQTLNPATMLAIVMLPLILLENIGETSLLLPLGIPWFYALIALVILSLSAQRTEES